MTIGTSLTAAQTPHELLQRWDAQQAAYIRHRALRFDTMLRVLERIGNGRPRVLDLASGPGSLAAAVIERFPGAEVVCADKDPVLLAIARDVLGSTGRVTVVDADLNDPSWVGTVGGPFDAVVSSTALHWLQPEVLTRVYFELAGLIRTGGVFLNGDHLCYDETSQPVLRQVAADDDDATQAEALGGGSDSWDEWWQSAEAQPAYALAVSERAERWRGKLEAPPKVTLEFHRAVLRSADFAEVGTVWQYLDDYVVYAVR
ncbi:class I SAM-dependent methyltransferase [Luethyella okanaganae]|uniref:Class I SAM-dependent methyltransferase n=1 Tax=Luethyella okanaganae TaxID=69372 RepID=A0ABW1VJC8_9MICO